MSRKLAAVLFLFTFCTPLSAGELSIAYITDIEGSRKKLHSFLSSHELFFRGKDGKYHLAPGAHFVCGGDVTDRFLGDLTVVDELLRLKAETPKRVHLLAGNRDMNKIRIFCELSKVALNQKPWEFQTEWHCWLKLKQLNDNRVNRLRWILKETMGAPNAFELRRQELLERNYPADDEAIVDSFLNHTKPGGPFANLLRLSNVIVRLDNTIFVHGGITKSNIGRIPNESRQFNSVDEWIEKLNHWYKKRLLSWQRDSRLWDGRSPIPGVELVNYSRRRGTNANNPVSVVYNRIIDKANKVTHPQDAVSDYLLRNGVNRLVLGHTPSGQSPVILRSRDDRFETIVADNSRGKESETPSLLTLKGNTTRCRAKVFIADKAFELVQETTIGNKTRIGKHTTNGAVIIGELDDKLVSYQLEPGFKVVYSLLTSEN